MSRSGVASNIPVFPGSYTRAENVLLASKVVPEFSSGMAEGGGGNLISLAEASVMSWRGLAEMWHPSAALE